MVKIKICGLRREEDICIVNKYLPDYAGFVFARSPRQVTVEWAEHLRMLLDKRIIPVGVFVNEAPEVIVELVKKGIIDVIQLHGDEDEIYIRQLRGLIPGVVIMKAVRVQMREQIQEAERLECDYLLLDTFSKDVYGGSGQQFDKALIPALEKPYFLAGGLSAENIGRNLALCNPYAVDISSAVETEGYKDEEKIKEFVERVRSYE